MFLKTFMAESETVVKVTNTRKYSRLKDMSS